jgi:hypothetical protein
MSYYECLECGKEYKDVTDLQYHLTSKSGCSINNNKNFDCENCGKSFTTKRAKDYHNKTSCKKSDLIILKEQLEKTKEDLEKTKEILIASTNQIQQLQTQIKKKPGRPKKILNNCHNTTNNNNINNNTTNNTTNNITNNHNVYQLTYVNFGDEELSKLTNKEKLRIGSSSYCSLNLLTELVHCNPRLPEQRNIFINNYKLECCHTITDGKLELNDLDGKLDDIITNRSGDLIEILKDKNVPIEPIHKERCLDLLDKIKQGDPRQIEKIKKELKYLIYNKNKMDDNVKKLK